MIKTDVLLSCGRCGARIRAELDVTELPDCYSIRAGTLDNDWALRWLRSHAEPQGQVIR